MPLSLCSQTAAMLTPLQLPPETKLKIPILDSEGSICRFHSVSTSDRLSLVHLRVRIIKCAIATFDHPMGDLKKGKYFIYFCTKVVAQKL